MQEVNSQLSFFFFLNYLDNMSDELEALIISSIDDLTKLEHIVKHSNENGMKNASESQYFQQINNFVENLGKIQTKIQNLGDLVDKEIPKSILSGLAESSGQSPDENLQASVKYLHEKSKFETTKAEYLIELLKQIKDLS